MFNILNFIFSRKYTYSNKITHQIFHQSRKKELYSKFQICDTFEKRLNFHILHLSLVMISLHNHDFVSIKKKILLDSIYKDYLNNFDLEFRELGLGDKIIEKKIFEISNITLIQYKKYKKYLVEDKNLFQKLLKNNFYSNNSYTKIKILSDYVKLQFKHLNSINLIDEIVDKIFIDVV